MAAVTFFEQIRKTFRSYTRGDKILSLIFGALCVFSFAALILSPQKIDYHEGIVGKIATLNPLFVDFNETDRDVSSLIFSGLVRYDPVTQAIVPDMADVSMDDSKLEYTFHLKPDVFWHDGKPVTSDDVYYTFHDVIENPNFQHPVLSENFNGVVITKVDAQTVKFRLTNPNSFFITNMAIGILPKHILEKVAVQDLKTHAFNKSPVGSGPYKIDGEISTKADNRTEVTLVRFDRYFGAKSALKTLNIVAYPTVEMLLKDRNNLDAMVKMTGSDLDKLRQDPAFALTPFHLPQYTAVFINMDRPVFKTKLVRLAFQKSIDKNALMSLIPDKQLIDTPLMELNQQDWLFKFSKEEAMGALFGSGYKFDKEKKEQYRKDKDGNVLNMRLVARKFPEHTRQAQEMDVLVKFLMDAWEGIGIQVKVDMLDTQEYNTKLAARDYDLVIAGQSLGYNLDTFAYWHSTQSTTGLNLSNYTSFEADSIIELIRNTFDVEKKNKALKKLAATLADDVPAVFLYRPTYYYVSKGKVKNLQLEHLSATADRFANISGWSLN